MFFSRFLPSVLVFVVLHFATPTVAEERLRVFVSVLPLAGLVDQIGGEHVLVESLVAPGHDPHSYDPQPSQLRRLSEADIFFRSGLPFENHWLPRLLQLNRNMRVVDLRDALPVKPAAAALASRGEQHGHGIEGDPHVWTAPANLLVMLERIHQELSLMAPAQAEFFTTNLATATAEISALDELLTLQLAATEQKSFVVFHPAWGYLAAAYGLEQIAIEEDEKEPGPRRIAELIDSIRAADIRLILIQPQFDRTIAATIANAVNAELVELDPLAYAIGPQLLAFGAVMEQQNAR